MEIPLGDIIFLRKIAIDVRKHAQCAVSGVQVGASVYAEDKDGHYDMFSAPNIEIAIGSYANVHAEVLALLIAIAEGYTKPLKCVITSNNRSHLAAMCGSCLQTFTYLNPDCEIEVIDDTGKVLIATNVRERQGPHGYITKSCKINNL